MDKRSRIIFALVAALPAPMLAVAVWGQPPYAFFAYLKLVVGICALAVTYALIKIDRRLGVISATLIVLAGVETFAHFDRSQWVPWNLGMIGMFIASTIAFVASLEDDYLENSDSGVTSGLGSAGAVGIALFLYMMPKHEQSVSEKQKEKEDLRYARDWVGINTKSKLQLNSNRTANYSIDEDKYKGSWSVEGSVVNIHATGGNGEIDLELIRQDNDDFAMLVPPVDATLDQCFYDSPSDDYDDSE